MILLNANIQDITGHAIGIDVSPQDIAVSGAVVLPMVSVELEGEGGAPGSAGMVMKASAPANAIAL